MVDGHIELASGALDSCPGQILDVQVQVTGFVSCEGSIRLRHTGFYQLKVDALVDHQDVPSRARHSGVDGHLEVVGGNYLADQSDEHGF